jgi:hypothetical protein
VKRVSELEARRRELLTRCEAQRAELSWRLAQLGPRRWAQALAGSAAAGAIGALQSQRRHPLAWVVAVGALLLLRRPREALSLLLRARGALTLAARAAQMLTLIRGLRRRRQTTPAG